MKKFNVEVSGSVPVYNLYTIEAEDEDSARENAIELFYLDHWDGENVHTHDISETT